MGLFAGVWILALSASAQDGGNATFEDLLERTEALEEQVREGVDPEELARARAQLSAVSQQLEMLLAAAEQEPEPQSVPRRLQAELQGFGVAGLSLGSEPLGLVIGDLSAGATATLGRRASFDGAVVLGLPDPSLEQAPLEDPTLEVDRLAIRVEATRAFAVTAGKLYSPYGYWNTHIPYGTFEQPTVSRPLVLAFERDEAAFATRQGALDFSGMGALGLWRVGYHAGVGNGRSPELHRTQDVGDTSWAKALWAQGWFQTPDGLQIGGSFAYDPIRIRTDDNGNPDPTARTLLSEDIDETVGVAHLAWVTRRTELLGELFVISHSTDAGTESNTSGYAQFSHRVRNTTPYVRGEYLEKWYADPLYAADGSQRSVAGGLVGVRQGMGAHAAVLGELAVHQQVRYGAFASTEASTVAANVLFVASL